MKKETEGDKLAAEVTALLRARNPVIILTTPEEARVEGVVAAVAANLRYSVKFWDCVRGVTGLDGKEVPPGKQAKMPGAALAAVSDSKTREVWVLRDFHPFWKSPAENRALRNLARELPNCPATEARTIVIITPTSEVPPEFADHVVVVKWKLPDREEMAGVFDTFVDGLADEIPDGKGKKIPHPGKATPADVREASIDAAMGLSVVQAQGVFSKSVVTRKGSIDPVMIAEAKKRIINASSGIEYYDPDPRGLDAVGGNAELKEWLLLLKNAFTEKARAFGLEKPRGVLLVGQSGCGKSLTAKAVGTAWSMPLLRLDMGAAKGGIVGESERKIRACFAVADAIGPCVLWIDELEKALAGASGGALDSGVSSDAFGALLTWMEEHKGPAFVLATANRVDQLPPEIFRRFDEIFFVDLPTRTERREILRVALAKTGRSLDGIDVDAVVNRTNGYTGAEVTGLVSKSLFLAFEDGGRALATADLLKTAEKVVPLSVTAAEKVKALRDWAKTRARPASLPEPEQVVGGRALDVEDLNSN